MVLDLVYNEETQEWEQKPEPFITIECETEEDFEFIGTAIAFYKKHIEKQEKPQTNADSVRAMSDEELADCIYQDVLGVVCRAKQERNESCSGYMCRDCLLEWLKQPAEVEHG